MQEKFDVESLVRRLTENLPASVQAFRADVSARQYPSDEESYHLPKETRAALETVLERKRAMRR